MFGHTEKQELMKWIDRTLWIPGDNPEEYPAAPIGNHGAALRGSAWQPKAHHRDYLVPEKVSTKGTKGDTKGASGKLWGIWQEFKKNLDRIPLVLGGYRHE